jgi:hypothetical protein
MNIVQLLSVSNPSQPSSTLWCYLEIMVVLPYYRSLSLFRSLLRSASVRLACRRERDELRFRSPCGLCTCRSGCSPTTWRAICSVLREDLFLELDRPDFAPSLYPRFLESTVAGAVLSTERRRHDRWFSSIFLVFVLAWVLFSFIAFFRFKCSIRIDSSMIVSGVFVRLTCPLGDSGLWIRLLSVGSKLTLSDDTPASHLISAMERPLELTPLFRLLS